MKSEQNFKVKKDDGLIVDLHDIGVWVESFHIYSPNVSRKKIKVPGFHGAYQSSVEIEERYIHADLKLEADNMIAFDQLKHHLYDLFFSEQNFTIIRDLTPDKEIFACYEGNFDINNITPEDGEFRLNLSMLDPYIYGQEKTLHFPSDHVVITNEGTAEADPIFELTATQKTTFAMISNLEEEYNLIGKPADDDVQEVDYRTSVMYENGSTLNQWQHTENREMISDDSNIDSLDGVMGTDDAGIRAQSYGTPQNRQRGPAIFKELSNPIQDFEIESTFDIISRFEQENFRMMIYFLDENMNNIGHMGIKDNSRLNKRRVPLAQLGQHNQGVSLLGDSSPRIDDARDTTLMYLRAKREGQRFTFYIAHWRNQRHETVWNESYFDVNNEFQGRLKYITLFIGSYQDRATPNRLRINSVEAFELKTVEEDQTPYILNPGDLVTFDHKNEDILVNGEVRPDLMTYIGADFFKLKKGENSLVVRPENSFETLAKFRERFK